MLAQRLPGLLPPLTAEELLETSMIHSVAGLIAKGALTRARPFRAPHHSASMAALVGGGIRAKPGEVSLAHNGVLFLDELPEFTAQVLDSLRQPLETGEVMVARANFHVRYPARVQLVAAANPCRCGHGGAGRGWCGKAPRCQRDYMGRISGPLMDRIDLQVDTPPVTAADLALPPPAEGTAEAAARVAEAREAQRARAAEAGAPRHGAERPHRRRLPRTRRRAGCGRQGAPHPSGGGGSPVGAGLDPNAPAGPRTIADLDGADGVRRGHIAEALIYRRMGPQGGGRRDRAGGVPRRPMDDRAPAPW